jgi:hypothetical protein
MADRPPDGGEGRVHNQHQHAAAAAAEQEAAGASRAGRIWHAEAPSALHAATNLRGQGAMPPPPISPLLSRLSLGWSLAAAFTAGALAFYTVRPPPPDLY